MGTATRLDFSSSDFIQVVRFCLPRKAEEMLITDLVLTVGAAKRMEGLPPDPQLWEPLFRHCLRLRPEFAPSAVVVVLELALQLRHGSAEFWHTMLSHCASLLEASSYYEDGAESNRQCEVANLADLVTALDLRKMGIAVNLYEMGIVFGEGAQITIMLDACWLLCATRMARRGSSVFSLIMFPVYVLVAMQHQFRFAHTNVFWLVPLVIVTFWQHYCGEEGDVCNLYLSGSSKMMLVLTSLVNSTMAWTAERNSRARFLAARSVQLTRQRIDAIASTLMPPMVVEEMRSLPFDAPLPSHKYQRATIAQSDLCGFTKLASTRMPQEVVQFIGDLFHLFDDLTDKHQVYKVETVGDAYIAGQADLPLTQKNHPVSVVLFGLEMVRAVHSWAGAHGFVDGQGCSVSCRVGIAHGACIGGIVGTEMQRYHLFGELMSELEVLESTAPQGLVQASTACKNVAEEIMRVEKIPSQLLSFEQRDLPYLQTSKGDVVPLEKAGGATFIVKSDSTFRGWIGA
ncbi:GUCY2C [Symbiodinium sp. KB8]|nr:GUCY2C [Symbiodinium sp. KB8]